MKNFQTFIGIDWSGAKAPINTKSIALATCARGHAAPILHPQYRSRQAIHDYILTHLKTSKRTLIGINANFGYAHEIGASQFGNQSHYKSLWTQVEKMNQATPNLFAGQYWESHPEIFWTHGKRPAHITLPKRQTEITCAANGYGYPESPFKLIGAKQVGKGGLAAMRLAHHLKATAGDKIAIWPFEQDILDTAHIVITEIYPRQFLMRSGHGTKKAKTLLELNAALAKMNSREMNDKSPFTDHDSDALISAAGLRYLCGTETIIPEYISDPPEMKNKAINFEGWIFGVGDKDEEQTSENDSTPVLI